MLVLHELETAHKTKFVQYTSLTVTEAFQAMS